MIKIAPSILSADFSKIGEEVRLLERSGADIIHCDVMDGVFVPNISFGMPVVGAVKKNTSLPLDVHLMIINPDRYIDAFIDAGASYITFHDVAVQDKSIIGILEKLKSKGIIGGIALNPDISLTHIERYIECLDMLLIMSVYAGFGGQKFIPESLKKIEEAAKLKNKYNKNLIIEVDGGINTENIRAVENSGADIAVAGSGVFGAKDKKDCIKTLRG
ncbi:MAG: ribulose-phosphate 3-epimerase [Clostridiales bacterium]|jgi:ribulose-phosphate 3-epimerase|nr:ribulose-phosphate 3-epimerase [Clostridiales bacterium]